MRFVDEVRTSLPAGMSLPDPIAAALEWLERHGHVERALRTGARYAKLPGTSLVSFQVADPDFVPAWTDTRDPAVNGRLAPIARTGGDGSWVALWRDHTDALRVVHMGSGSGSTLLGVIGSPVDFLRWLAIGYEEPAFAEQFGLAPEVAADEDYLPPTDFQDWVALTFGVTIPRTGAELLPTPPLMGDEASDDPFQRWLQAQRREGVVTAVSLSTDHHFSKENAPVIQLVPGLGVAGDAHAGATVKHRSRVARDPSQPNLRQVHLFHAELLDALAVRPGELGENVTTRGVPLLELPAGTRLHLGDEAVVALTGLRNPCAQIERHRAGLLAAVLETRPDGTVVRKAGVMGVVVRGGEVRPGDPVRVELPAEPHVALGPV